MCMHAKGCAREMYGAHAFVRAADKVHTMFRVAQELLAHTHTLALAQPDTRSSDRDGAQQVSAQERQKYFNGLGQGIPNRACPESGGGR